MGPARLGSARHQAAVRGLEPGLAARVLGHPQGQGDPQSALRAWHKRVLQVARRSDLSRLSEVGSRVRSSLAEGGDALGVQAPGEPAGLLPVLPGRTPGALLC